LGKNELLRPVLPNPNREERCIVERVDVPKLLPHNSGAIDAVFNEILIKTMVEALQFVLDKVWNW
jgi:hypothetical protein